MLCFPSDKFKERYPTNEFTGTICDVDDFWQGCRENWYRQLLATGKVKRIRTPNLSESEIMTLVILFHQSQYRNFKAYVQVYLRSEFPKLVSYTRFVELMPRIGIPLLAYFQQYKGDCTGISFVDATPIIVCHNRRIYRHKVFDGIAERGKTSMGWFFGFKPHIVVNERGELLAFSITPGNVDDRKPVPDMARDLFGKLFDDRGYISQKLFEELMADGVQLITAIRRKMKRRLMLLEDKILLRKRAIIETINDQLKNISQIEHTRHRSPNNFFVNLVVGLIAYCHKEKKPALNLSTQDCKLLCLNG